MKLCLVYSATQPLPISNSCACAPKAVQSQFQRLLRRQHLILASLEVPPRRQLPRQLRLLLQSQWRRVPQHHHSHPSAVLVSQLLRPLQLLLQLLSPFFEVQHLAKAAPKVAPASAPKKAAPQPFTFFGILKDPTSKLP